jgi:hypothetical protein
MKRGTATYRDANISNKNSDTLMQQLYVYYTMTTRKAVYVENRALMLLSLGIT